MSYLGIIKKEEIEGLTTDQLEDYLEQNNCYDNVFSNKILEKIVNSIPLDENNFDEMLHETIFQPKIDLMNEFYFFIYNHYKEKIINLKFNFFLELEEKCFGIIELEKRKIALSVFNNIYENLEIKFIDIIGEVNTEYEYKHTQLLTDKIFKIYMYQLSFKKSICTTENMINFLTGNIEFYEDDFYNDNIEIINAVYFEMIVQILIVLNNKNNFHEDKYFNNIFYNECKFEDNKEIFTEVFGYEFTKYIVQTSTSLNKAEIESLYEVLTSQNLVHKRTKEKFQEFVYYEFKLKISKIITHPYKANWEHDARVLFMNTEYHKMKLKKSNSTGFF